MSKSYTTSFPDNVNYVENGDPVEASKANAASRDLAKRTTALKERVDNALLGTGLFDWEATVQADLVEGMAVYQDNDGIYRPALAETTSYNINGSPVTTADTKSFVEGIVQYKHTSTNANIMLAGSLTMTSSELSNITISGSAETGQLFLTDDSNNPGKITNDYSSLPDVKISVAVSKGPDADGNYFLTVLPTWREFFADNIGVSSVVTKLQRLNDSIELYDLNTNSSVGDSEVSGPIGIKARFEAERNTDTDGDQALKNVDSDGGFNYGPIVESIKSGDTNTLTISGGKSDPNNSGYSYGNLTINAVTQNSARVGNVEFLRLENTPLVETNSIYYYSLQPSPLGYIEGKVPIPLDGLSGDFDLTLNFLIFSRGSGTMPDLPMKFKKLQRPSSATAIPTSFTSLGSLALSGKGSVGNNQYFEIDAPIINNSNVSTVVNAGDTVIFRVDRDQAGGYSADIGVIDIRWKLTPSS